MITKLIIPNIIPNMYFKNHYFKLLILSIAFFLVSIPFPSNAYHPFFIDIRNYLETPIIYLLMTCVLVNLGIYLKNFIDKTYIQAAFDLEFIYYGIIVKAVICMTVFFDRPEVSAPKFLTVAELIFLFIYSVYIAVSLSFIWQSFTGLLFVLRRKSINAHWVDNILSDKQVVNSKKLELDSKIISVYFNGFLLDEMKNIIHYKDQFFNLTVFKSYILDKGCKLDELSDEDLIIIKMIQI